MRLGTGRGYQNVLERLYLLGLVVFEDLELFGLEVEYWLAVVSRVSIDTNEVGLGAKDLRLLLLLLRSSRLRDGDRACCDGKSKEPENAAAHRSPLPLHRRVWLAVTSVRQKR